MASITSGVSPASAPAPDPFLSYHSMTTLTSGSVAGISGQEGSAVGARGQRPERRYYDVQGTELWWTKGQVLLLPDVLGGLACQEGQCHLEDPAVSDPSSGHEHQHLDLAEKLSLSTPEQSLP